MWSRTSDEPELARVRTAEAKRRTHLANKRTFAAWIRTALALIALGVGIAGYFHLAGDSRGQISVGSPISLTLLLGAIPILLGLLALLLIVLR